MTAAPDFVAPVIGWRVWSLVQRDGSTTLRSLYTNVVWEAGEPLEATCCRSRRQVLRPWRTYVPCHPAPRFSCTCGVYAAFEPEPIVPLLIPPATPPQGEVGRVLGRVALWGDVVECARGWRASLAYPLQLYLWPPAIGARQRTSSAGELGEELSSYGVPIEWVNASARSQLLS